MNLSWSILPCKSANEVVQRRYFAWNLLSTIQSGVPVLMIFIGIQLRGFRDDQTICSPASRIHPANGFPTLYFRFIEAIVMPLV